MNASSLLIALIALAGGAHATEQQPTNVGQFGQKRAQMFAEFKSIESKSHHDRIRILQEAETCIQAATNRDQYQACEKREQESREASNAEAKSRREALRSRAEQMRQAMANRN